MNTATILICVILVTKLSAFCNEVNCTGQPNCISIKKCTPFVTFLEAVEKPLKSSVVNFLKAHECGFEDGYPKVCCAELPKNLKILKTTTPPTILTTPIVTTTIKPVTATVKPLRTTVKTTTAKPLTTSEQITKKPSSVVTADISTFSNKDKRIEEFNAAFYDLLDFDLFRRRRKLYDGLEVEIR